MDIRLKHQLVVNTVLALSSLVLFSQSHEMRDWQRIGAGGELAAVAWTQK